MKRNDESLFDKLFGPNNVTDQTEAVLFVVENISWGWDPEKLGKIFETDESFRKHCLKVYDDFCENKREDVYHMSGEQLMNEVYEMTRTFGGVIDCNGHYIKRFDAVTAVLDFFPKETFIKVGEFMNYVMGPNRRGGDLTKPDPNGEWAKDENMIYNHIGFLLENKFGLELAGRFTYEYNLVLDLFR